MTEIKKPKVATEDIVPEQYSFTHINPMTKLQPYPNIASTCMEQMLKRKLVIKKPSCYRNEIIDACICFSKTEGHSFNIRKKRKILEYDDNKLSNFLVLDVGSIHSCMDNVSYTCYYVTTIEKCYDAIIAIPQVEPDHSKAIEEKLKELNLFDKFELWGDFKQVYNFCIHFKAYVSKQKEDTFRKFFPDDYEIRENKGYLKYMLEKERKEAHEAVDSAFDEEEKQLFDEQTETESEKQSVTDTYVAPIVDMPPIAPYDNDYSVYQSMINLFNLCEPKTILTGLGFYIINAVPQLSDKENIYSLSIIAPSKHQAYAKKVCDIMHRLVFNETKHPSVQFNVSEKIKSYFKRSNYNLPIVVTNDNFTKEDSQKFSKALDEYYGNNPNRRRDSLIIIAKKEFDSNHLLKISFNAKESPETEKAMKALKADTFFCNTIKDFLENITSRYSSRDFRCHYDPYAGEKDNAELIRREISKKIQELSNSYTLTYEDAVKYAPIVFFLEEFYSYLLQSQAISEEEYTLLSRNLQEVYSLDGVEVDDTSVEDSDPTLEQISEILLSCVAEAYANDNIPDDTNSDFYIYKGCKEHNELICFKHQQISPMKCIIDLIVEAGMEDRISDIKELALQETIGESLKHIWKDSKITYAKTGLLYSTKKGKIIAIIPESIKAYSKS